MLSERLGPDKADELAQVFTRGEWTHDHPLDVETLRGLGLPVNTDMPPEIEEYMRLFPQSTTGRPSVQYIPVPYRGPTGSPRPSRPSLGR